MVPMVVGRDDNGADDGFFDEDAGDAYVAIGIGLVSFDFSFWVTLYRHCHGSGSGNDCGPCLFESWPWPGGWGEGRGRLKHSTLANRKPCSLGERRQ